MFIKVYNNKEEKEQTINVADFDAEVHFHRNTKEPFTKADIATFAVETKKKK